MSESQSIPKLTSLAHSSGCGCKVNPGGLSEILEGLRQSPGFSSIQRHEDASVFKLNETESLLSTVDFFMPVVDDPYDFGAIAAANALSDIFAMGGWPVQAISVLGWPMSKLPAALASQVLQGAESSCRKAGISISGGHTVDSQEPFFGLSVNGIVKNKDLKTNQGAQEGDLLFLTKPLGIGMVLSALKRGRSEIPCLDVLNAMKQLNLAGIELAKINGVHAMTDVTGFGLLGHALEMIADSKVTLNLHFQNIPRFAGVSDCMKSFIYPDITTSNFNWIKNSVNELNAEALFLLCDPQTSGGLLISASPDVESEVVEILKKHNCHSSPIGYFDSWNGKPIFVQDQL
jgi:selenide,water dikinase